MSKKKVKVEEPKPKAGKTRIGNISNTPPLASQGNQGEIFDKIMKQKYPWWK
jgi:hypothetical protein